MTTQPKDLMTLEEAATVLKAYKKHLDDCESYDSSMLSRGEKVRLAAITSALHHLEAGRNGCQCMEFNEAQQPCTDNEGYGALLRVWDGEWRIGSLSLNPIAFCPWCGGKVPSAPEVKG